MARRGRPRKKTKSEAKNTDEKPVEKEQELHVSPAKETPVEKPVELEATTSGEYVAATESGSEVEGKHVGTDNVEKKRKVESADEDEAADEDLTKAKKPKVESSKRKISIRIERCNS